VEVIISWHALQKKKAESNINKPIVPNGEKKITVQQQHGRRRSRGFENFLI
jgi:hypothetical protein